jgi:outer membrane protein TolC
MNYGEMSMGSHQTTTKQALKRKKQALKRRRMKNKIWLSCLLVWSPFFIGAQENIIRPEAFLLTVLEQHPLAKQANLIPEFAETYVLKARGGFDPKINYDLNQKYYGDKLYYSLSDAQLKIPTWYGLSLKTGLEQNRGVYLDPQGATPQNGLWYGGIEANLGNGLLIDERRAELKKAAIFQQSSALEKRLALNELLFEAGYAYWDWFEQYHGLQILKEALDVSAVRLKAIQRMAELGDRPVIDTVEAAIQFQTRAAAYTEQLTAFQNAGATLNRFLWQSNGVPQELNEFALPLAKDTVALQGPKLITVGPLDAAVEGHPYLAIIDFKLEALDIEKKFAKEQLKPILSVNYNFLNEPIQYNPFAQFSANDYKWGITAQMPLMYRKERAAYQQTQLKIEQTEYDRLDQKASLKAKLLSARFDYLNALAQKEIYIENANSTRKLLEAELNLFSTGESTLFMINAREMAAFQAELKAINYIAKTEQLWLKWQFLQATLVR